jgi:hypothetical protein
MKAADITALLRTKAEKYAAPGNVKRRQSANVSAPAG